MPRKIRSPAASRPRRSNIPKPWLEARDLPPLLRKVRPYTMVPDESMTELARIVQTALTFNIPGSFVECGAWRGGAAFLMGDLLRRAGVTDRKVWAFDSFEGLPAPKAIDGGAALEYAQDTDSDEYYDNCRATFERAKRDAKALGVGSQVKLVKGWFEETLPAHRDAIGPIAVLRVDGNWHASVRCCLDTLFDQVVDGGFVLFHTYYTYEGCAVAAHEFLGERRLGYPMEGVIGHRDGPEDYQSALFRKATTTWTALRQQYLAAQDIQATVPAGATVILADQEEWEDKPRGYRFLPFLECDGYYNGPPGDDAQAVAELDRLRAAGARYLVFAWPAFWWFDSYPAFARRVRRRFPCLRENERVVIFDLRGDKGGGRP